MPASVSYSELYSGLRKKQQLLMACCHQYWTRKKLRFQMRVHRFFVTKYRRNVFTKEGVDDLRVILANVCVDFESELIEFDGEDDPVHLLVNDPPKVSISKLVNSLKGASSLLIRKKGYPNIKKKRWGNALWSPSYFAGSCGGAPIAIIRQYIEQQRTPN